MSWADKQQSQADCYRPEPSFTARPLEGPGRWAVIQEGLILYTDDDMLFVTGDPALLSPMVIAVTHAYDAGETATAAFDRLRGDIPAQSGDLTTMLWPPRHHLVTA